MVYVTSVKLTVVNYLFTPPLIGEVRVVPCAFWVTVFAGIKLVAIPDFLQRAIKELVF